MSAKKFSQFRAHPWHGIEAGPDLPGTVNVFIEITPNDPIKYEIDKDTGYLVVDRVQRTSSLPPAVYGLVPRTYCGSRVAALTGDGLEGDGDPLDVVIFSERPIGQADVLAEAKVVGGLCTVDKGEADDKIVAVLPSDRVYGGIADISELPEVFVERLRHYFETYKWLPGMDKSPCVVNSVYGREQALKVVEAAIADYEELVGGSEVKAANQ
ncbi:inorganic pyrophosphatase [Natronospira bacteriovora]|uniref:inorganic diphosphatase n=1 Tax=Natronospira bacteriovora TaxID=3069753 RepID=A0ABU0W9G7_9GAMM|nr:inorganic pyrophosphatase [Natronospira sp. AB-CW4]MDQ2070684.1 inorganic pyrophosphatase [Natronospira sp. AB-CW4]